LRQTFARRSQPAAPKPALVPCAGLPAAPFGFGNLRQAINEPKVASIFDPGRPCDGGRLSLRECSLPPSPPAEKATARQDQARQASTREAVRRHGRSPPAPSGLGAFTETFRAEGLPSSAARAIRDAGIRFPLARKGKPRRSGAGTSWKENQDEAYQHQQQIAAVLRLVAQ
jgi:hypothetical protein